MHQMRRGVNARAVARFQQDRLQHGAGGALAVSARHCDDRASKAQAHAVSNGFDTLQRHVDGGGVQALTMGEPVG